jgi:hypothetical protein
MERGSGAVVRGSGLGLPLANWRVTTAAPNDSGNNPKARVFQDLERGASILGQKWRQGRYLTEKVCGMRSANESKAEAAARQDNTN